MQVLKTLSTHEHEWNLYQKEQKERSKEELFDSSITPFIPFEYLKQTHIKTSNKDNKLSRKRFFGGSFYPSEKQINYFIKNNNKSKKILDGKKGTIIIADTSGFHRGGFAKKGGRLMSTFVYYPYYDPIKSRLIANKICKSKLSTIQRDFLK